LRWDDQEKIKEKVGGRGGGKSSEPAAASSGADDLMVEYAKSNRSKCKKCKDQIDKVRLDKFLPFNFFINQMDLRFEMFKSNKRDANLRKKLKSWRSPLLAS